MLTIVLSVLAGLATGTLVFVVAQGGVLGLGLGAVAAAAGYIAVSSQLEKPRLIGGTAVELLPDGEHAFKVIDEANRRVASISAISSQIGNRQVNKEASDFVVATRALISYVESDPSAYPTLQHYINVYGQQTESLLTGYRDVERSGTDSGDAVEHTVKALRAMENTAAGELKRAVEAKTLALTADSDAIVRLASMDGYEADDPDAPVQTAGDQP